MLGLRSIKENEKEKTLFLPLIQVRFWLDVIVWGRSNLTLFSVRLLFPCMLWWCCNGSGLDRSCLCPSHLLCSQARLRVYWARFRWFNDWKLLLDRLFWFRNASLWSQIVDGLGFGDVTLFRWLDGGFELIWLWCDFDCYCDEKCFFCYQFLCRFGIDGILWGCALRCLDAVYVWLYLCFAGEWIFGLCMISAPGNFCAFKLAPFADELQVIFIVLDLVLGFVERADKNGFWIGMRGTYCASVPEFVL